jgi:Rrf2 family cysteine metabolism transcriptional repressor
MKISTRGEYGLRALMELGTEPGSAMSLRDIANRQHISLDYLEQIVPALKNAGLVRSKRGAQGGYLLARDPADITIFDALVALEGPFDPMSCLSTGPSTVPGCGASNSCAVQEVWREMKDAVEGVLKRITLEELLQRQNSRFGVPIRTHAEENQIMSLVVLN